MFAEYKEILKVVCSKAWDTPNCQEQMETVLCDIEDSPDYCLEAEGFVLMGLLKRLCLMAFQSKDRDLLNLIIMTLIDLDEVMDDAKSMMDEVFARMDEKEAPGEEDKEAETEAVADEGGRIEPEKKEPTLEKIEQPSKDEERDRILNKKYNVRKKILDYVLANVNSDSFSINDVQAILRKYYDDVLKKPEREDSTIKVYSTNYTRYMVEEGLATKDEIEGAIPHERSEKRFHLVKKESKIIKEELDKTDRFSLSKPAQYILLWSEKNVTDIIEIEAMVTHPLGGSVKPYSGNALLQAFEELEKKGIAKKVTKGKYIIRREIVS